MATFTPDIMKMWQSMLSLLKTSIMIIALSTWPTRQAAIAVSVFTR